MVFETTKVFIWIFESYFKITSLTNENWQTRFAPTFFVKSIALWMHKRNNDLNLLKWSNLKNSLQEYFRPANFHRIACDKLDNCK